MTVRNWKKDFNNFDTFIKSINLEKYKYLRKIKTVEQDLPKDLLPLDIFYRYYWDNTDFRDYEEIFQIYWDEKLKNICSFVKKYFYGCSLQFVEEGFKARLYRIWMSILTQFYFQYLWNRLFDEKLISNPDLDRLGIDCVLELKDLKIGFQVEKISYRREVSSRKFTKRQQKYVDILVEVPYIVIDREDLLKKIESKRVKEKNKKKYKELLNIYNSYFHQYDNGFVVFKGSYLKKLKEIVLSNKLEDIKKITYQEILDRFNIKF